jgi:hypothetical protein
MLDPTVRRRIDLLSRESAIHDLGAFGLFVGPRTGANKRNQDQIDDYCVRQLICGLLSNPGEPIPCLIEMLDPDPDADWPDALLTWLDGSRTGVEVTAAGSEAYQKQLTNEDRIASKLPEGEIAIFDASVDGYVGEHIESIANDVRIAIDRKARARLSGTKYRGVPTCDLVVYENAEGGIFIESNDTESISKVVLALHFGPQALSSEIAASFRNVHLISGRFFVHSVLGNARIYRIASEKLEAAS